MPPMIGTPTPSTAASTTSVAGASSSSCSGCTRTTWSATCSGRSRGRSCPFWRSPKPTRCTRSRRSGGPHRFTRRHGEALHPAREPLATLAHIRRTIGEYNFAGQYQQSPAPLGGGLVKEAWFKRYGEHERPERFEHIVQSWDTANKATELSDFRVCTTCGVRGKNLYLLELLRQRLEYPALKRAVREQRDRSAASVVLIEDKASGTQLIQELIADGCYGVTRYQPTTDKIKRLNAQTGMIENGVFHIPESASWLAEYLHEMTVFPNGKHDDQVESTAQFLDWFKKPFPGQGIFEYYREMAQQLKPPEPVYVRLKAPPGIGAVQTRSGQRTTIGEDRIVEVSAADADCGSGANDAVRSAT